MPALLCISPPRISCPLYTPDTKVLVGLVPPAHPPGLEADEEEEEKKEEGAEGEEGDKKEGEGAAAGADSAAAGAPSQDFAGGSAGGESESVMDDDDLGVVDAEDLDLDRLAEEREVRQLLVVSMETFKLVKEGAGWGSCVSNVLSPQLHWLVTNKVWSAQHS